MDLQSSSFAADEISAPKPTRLLFHLPWRISVLVWALFLLCFYATLQTPATGLSQLWVAVIRLLFSNTSAVNLWGLVLDRFIAIVYPLKYITFMTRRRSTQVIFFSWVPTVSFNALKVTLWMPYFKTMECPFYMAEYDFLCVPSKRCINTLLRINDISCTQVWSFNTHRSKTVTF